MTRSPSTWRELGTFLKKTIAEFQASHPQLLSAALGYFTLFSIAPLMIIGTAFVGSIWSRPGLQMGVLTHLSTILGEDAASSIADWMAFTTSSKRGGASLFSFVILFMAATRIFNHLRTALDVIWQVPPKSDSFFRNFFRTTFKSLAMMVGLILFLFAFFFTDALFAIGITFLRDYFPGAGSLPLVQIANGIVSFLLFMILFGVTYKYVPDTPVAWTDVWPGALLTSAIFTIGKILIGLYLQYLSFSSLYGAAGSVIVLMVWIYSAAQIFFFGAQFTRLYALTYGSRRPPR